MSYAASAALQTAVFSEISTGPTAALINNTPCFDMPPAGDQTSLFVLLGAEKSRSRADTTANITLHQFVMSVVCKDSGFLNAKQIAGTLSTQLPKAALTLSTGTLVDFTFARATARRTDQGASRQIDLIFQARIDDHPILT